jgi:DMSO/TMAO reductase YedYZ molybdopterin-dependent catalytic subunit
MSARFGVEKMTSPVHRRQFLKATSAVGLSAGALSESARLALGADEPGTRPPQERRRTPGVLKPFLTAPTEFVDVSRGNPKPWSLEGEARAKARLTRETWRLEIVSDGSSELGRQFRHEDDTAIDLPTLEEIGKEHGLKFLKAMQCNNIPLPLGQGLWEGVPLRVLLLRMGKLANVRRVFYWGYHNNDPAQLFQSSLGMNQVMETPPWDLAPLVAYKLNGQPIPPIRGGPVRMVVPWAHGFKSIKWLQKIVLTNDYKANDTYALQNNDPDSYLKTAAYIAKGPREFKKGELVTIEGTAMSGWSGLKRVEYWTRADAGTQGKLADDDPAWKLAGWLPCEVMPSPDDWTALLPPGTAPREVWGFDHATGKPRDWPPRYSVIPWSVTLRDLPVGVHEFRVRTVDLNGFAQPEPRAYQKSGMNLVQCALVTVTP